MSNISSRKADHIDLCIEGDVGFHQKTNLFEEVELIHDALPELAVSDIDLRTEFAGVTLQAPLVIAAMTGGVDRAEEINRNLAKTAQKYGIGFAFGSQRPWLSKNIRDGYLVRDVAPDALLLGNIGIVQAAQTTSKALADMLNACGVNAVCIHLNPAMELVQPEGDQDFRYGLETIARLQEDLDIPIIIKETGCGLSRSVGERITKLGIEWVDISGAGGTSWVAVETHRAQDKKKRLGHTFWDWGIPTAASVAQLNGLGLGMCATGGIRNGLMIAKAVAMGASCGGMARAFLQAYAAGGVEGLEQEIEQVIQEIRIAFLLCGAKNVREMQERPLVFGPKLQRWIPKDA
ncbi:MAG: type 2 isopentenyl-diphosphate Delta-isomerase, partial [Myxococcota bacterium]|nr:type 2 isopentenyl-diphosphate Delta-isomerase [Myxococcota bacterium]